MTVNAEIKPNVERLRLVRDAILKYPHLHDQDTFRGINPNEPAGCNTTYCAAGWTVEVTGAHWTGSDGVEGPFIIDTRGVTGPRGRVLPVADYAQAALGLNVVQTDNLFYQLDAEQVVPYLDALIVEAERETSQ